VIEPRLAQELDMLRTRYPDLEYHEAQRWIHLLAYPLPEGWTPRVIPVAFHVPVGYPATQPYAFSIPADTRFNGAVPANSAASSPPFAGSWLQLSWTSEPWVAASDPRTGSNLVLWTLGFSHRFKEGV
jgi:hypothetical protein